MNTSTKHSPRLPGTPQEGNLSDVQTSFTPSEEALELKGIVDGIGKKVAGAIDMMKKERDIRRRLIEHIATIVESKFDFHVYSSGKDIRKIGNINDKIFGNETLLTFAINQKDTELLQILLTHPDILVNEKNPLNKHTVLMQATLAGDLEGVKLLLAHPKILANEVDSGGNSALLMSLTWGRIEITKLLLADPRLDIKKHDQGKKALEDKLPIDLRILIEEAMRK